MSTWVSALWGLAGGFVVEAHKLIHDIRVANGWPWRKRKHGPLPILTAIGLRILIGGVVAGAAAAGGQLAGPFGAFGFGISAPFLIERMAGSMPESVPVAGYAAKDSESNTSSGSMV